MPTISEAEDAFVFVNEQPVDEDEDDGFVRLTTAKSAEDLNENNSVLEKDSSSVFDLNEEDAAVLRKRNMFFLALAAFFLVVPLLHFCIAVLEKLRSEMFACASGGWPEPGLLYTTSEIDHWNPQMLSLDELLRQLDEESDAPELIESPTFSVPAAVPTPGLPEKEGQRQHVGLLAAAAPPEIKPRVFETVPIPSRGSSWELNSNTNYNEGANFPSPDSSRDRKVTGSRSISVRGDMDLTTTTRPVVRTVQIPSMGRAYYQDTDMDSGSPYATESMGQVVQIPARSLIPFAAPKISPLQVNIPKSPKNGHGINYAPVPGYPTVVSIPTYNETQHGNNNNKHDDAGLEQPGEAAHLRELVYVEEELAAATKSLHNCDILTQYSFDSFLREHENVFVTFFYPCAAYKIKFVPLWNNFTTALSELGLSVKTAVINCHSHPSVCRDQDVERSPVSRFFHKAKAVRPDYRNKRTVKKLVKYTKRVLDHFDSWEEGEGEFAMPPAPVKDPVVATDPVGRPLAFVKKHRLNSVDSARMESVPSTSTAPRKSGARGSKQKEVGLMVTPPSMGDKAV